MGKRWISSDFPTDARILQCSRLARLTFVFVCLLADDDGGFRAHPRLVRGRCFPYDDDLSDRRMESVLVELEVAGLIRRSTRGSDSWGEVIDWDGWQKRPTKQRPTMPRWLRQLILTRDDGRCRVCGATEEPEIDHVIPYSRGGSFDDPENLQVLCRRHNAEKSDRMPNEWIPS